MFEKSVLRYSRAMAVISVCAMLAVIFCPRLAEGAELVGERMTLVVDEDPFTLRFLDADGAEMLVSDGPITYTTVRAQHTYRLVLWWLWTRGIEASRQKVDRVVSMEREGDSIVADLGGKSGEPLVRMKAFFIDGRTLKVEMEVLDNDEVNRFRVRFRRDADDRYYGMGERVNAVEHSGERLSNWSEENGLGLSYLSEVWPKAPFNPFPRGRDTTYFPSPIYINPGKGYGFLLDDVHNSTFDFGKKCKKTLEIENWNERFDFLVFAGETPLELIEAQTAYTGRIKVPTPWAFAPMNAVVEGEDRVLEVARLLREEGIPTTAIWSESWWWRVEWEVNRDLYPDYEGMNAALQDDGFRSLAYYQPYISLETKAFAEGDANGYFTKDKNGETYDFILGVWAKAQLDLTNPEAREWWVDSFFQNSLDMGVDGWMHDFGEHTPPDSVSYDGRSGWEVHNEYNVTWSKLGREFFDKARPDGDYCFYIRGGYTGVQKYASIMWTGDQNSNFERYDGLPSNLPSILSVGISGHPICTTDIAGFNCFVNRSSDRELFMRWTELGALLPVMRIHRGQDEVCDHWSFDRDPETLAHYKDHAILHTALFPYFYTLAHQAADKGWPVIRHLMLHYPDDPETWRLDYQFLVGDRVLAAPVLERGAREWEVYFPEGEWVHWWTGDAFEGPGRAVVSADLGETPLFVRSGKILPLFDSRIDTLAKEDRPDLMGYDDANASMKFLFHGTGTDEYKLWDGTAIRCERRSMAEQGRCEARGAPVKRTYAYEFK